jgi:putative transposase
VGQNPGPHPPDRAKDGPQRRRLTEAAGLPIGLAIDGANRNDFNMARETIASLPVARPEPSAKPSPGLGLDKGDASQEVRDLAQEFGFTAHIRARGEEAQALKQEAGFRARRWVVEMIPSYTTISAWRGTLLHKASDARKED